MVSQSPEVGLRRDRPNVKGVTVQPSRVTHTIVGMIYLFFFMRVYADYISYVWGYTGFDYRPLDNWELLFVGGGVGLVSFAMPTRIRRPSSIFIWLLYAFVFVPTMAITFMLGEFQSVAYVLPLGALTAMMVLACVVSDLPLKAPRRPPAMPGNGFVVTILVLLVASASVLYVVYGNILSFASVDDVYYQRFAASEIGGGVIGYIRTHFAYALAPATLALGLCSRAHRWMIPLAFGAFAYSYMIDAAKIALLIPFAMVALYIILVRTGASVTIFTSALTFLSFVCSLLTSQVSFIRFLADLVLLRSISVPAQTFHQYYDLFSQRGYTWWSNVSGIRWFVPPPGGFSHDAQWPTLGLIIGREYYGNTLMNANANLFVGEGVAAAGPFGVLVVGLLFCVWLRLLDTASRTWDARFVLLVMSPLGLCLTNVHLSTLLTSFGGVFWMLWFVFYKARRGIDASEMTGQGAV